jgi:hypothetical protein
MMKFLLAVVVLAVVGYVIWDRNFSRTAQIEVAYKACMKQLGAAADKVKANAANSSPKHDDAAGALTRGLGDAMTSMMQGFGGAVCGTIKDTCTQDFDHPVCQAALNRVNGVVN